MKRSILLACIVSLPLVAMADSTIPVVQFTVGFGHKVDIQKINVLGFRAGSDYVLNATEQDGNKNKRSVVILGIVAAAAIGAAIGANDNDKPVEEDCFIPITGNPDGTLSGTLVCR